MLRNKICFAPENEQGASPEGPGVSPEQMREILDFDPFTPPAKDAPDGGEGEGPQAKSGGEPPPSTEKPEAEAGEGLAASTTSPAASPSQSSEPAKKEDEGDPLADFRKQISDFLNKKPEVKEAQPQPAPPKAAEPAKAGVAAEPAEGAKYNFTVPDAVVEAIRSDDPAVAKQGLSAVVNSVMNQLVKDFGGALVELRKELMEQAPRAAMERVTAEQTVQKIKDDFYGNWPGLKQAADSIPGVDAAIWSTIVQAGKNAGVTSWTPDFRDNIGAMLHVSLGIPLPQGKTAPTTKPAAVASKPTRIFNAGGGTGGRTNGAASDEFMEVLGAGQ